MGGLYESDFVERLQRGVEGLLKDWGLSPDAAVTLLTVSENATFKVVETDTSRTLVVRVHRPGYHSRAEIASELTWIQALRHGDIVSTPAPVVLLDKAVQGRVHQNVAVQEDTFIAGFDDDGELRDVVAFEYMSGVEPADDDALEDGFHELGSISARLHTHSRGWRKPPDFVRKTWNFDSIIGDSPHWGPWQNALALDAAGYEVLSRAVDELKRRTDEYTMHESRFGLIHADLRLANLLVDGERLGVIDFDDCGFGWYGYDFAAAVSFIEREPCVPRLFDAWVDGYRAVAELSTEEEAMIPTFVMLRRLQLTAWIASHAETPTAQEFGDGFTAGTVAMAQRFLDGLRPFGA